MTTYAITGNDEHLMAIDPNVFYQHPLLSLCGREVRVWDRDAYQARLILARIDGTAPWWSGPRRGPSCPECIARLRAAKARGDASTSAGPHAGAVRPVSATRSLAIRSHVR